MNATFTSAGTRELPMSIPKITRADLGLILPRLDDTCLDPQGHTIPSRREQLDKNIALYAWCYDLGGRIADVKTVKGKGDDPGVRFVGKFRARLNPAIADRWFISGRCHVPRFFEEQMYAQVLDVKKVDPNATMDFLIRVGIKPSNPNKPSTVGYEWTVQTLVSMDVYEDPVAKLFDQAVSPPALAAPIATAATPATTVADSTPATNGASEMAVATPSEGVSSGENHRRGRRV